MIAAPFLDTGTLTVGWIIGTGVAVILVIAVLAWDALRDRTEPFSAPSALQPADGVTASDPQPMAPIVGTDAELVSADPDCSPGSALTGGSKVAGPYKVAGYIDASPQWLAENPHPPMAMFGLDDHDEQPAVLPSGVATGRSRQAHPSGPMGRTLADILDVHFPTKEGSQ